MKAIEISDAMRGAAASIAAGKSSALHEEDFMLKRICAGDAVAGVGKYLNGGRSAAARLHEKRKQFLPPEPIRLLDFAAGFGRVTRHLPDFFVGDDVHASDIHPQACRFITDNFNIPAHVSSTDPNQLELPGRFHMIFVISLFSHLPDETFGPWLRTLYDQLTDGGHLMFTAHGQTSLQRPGNVYGGQLDEESGFKFVRKSEQHDLDTNDYGSMAVSFPYMTKKLAEFTPHARLRLFEGGMWAAVQDMWVIERPI